VKVYLDTSIVLAWLLEGGDQLAQVPPQAEVAASRLLWLETARVIERGIRTGAVSAETAVKVRQAFDQTMRGVSRLRLGEEILRRAEGSFPLVVRSLDAIHLASALAWNGNAEPGELQLWSLDRQLNQCAAAMGLATPWL
jgi:predicted nucleic acid-binding protein